MGRQSVNGIDIKTALGIHCFVIGIAILFSMLLLRRRGLLTFLHTGTWMVLALWIYFFYNPLSMLFYGDLGRYREALQLITREGTSRVFWILGVILSGVAVYLFVYLRNRTPQKEAAFARQPMQSIEWSMSQIIVLSVFLIAALYSLLYLRTKGLLVTSNIDVEYENGRIVGGATGYAVVAHAFFIYIVAILLLRGKRASYIVGWIFAVGYVLLRLYDTQGRWTVVSLIAAIGMVELLRVRLREVDFHKIGSKKKTTRVLRTIAIVFGAAAMAIFLSVRGHSSIADVNELNWAHGQEALRNNDTAMLPVLYVESKLAEIHGYDYGVSLLSQVVLGWLPRQYFPWKGDLERILIDRGPPRFGLAIDDWLYGAKFTVMGSFYNHGGIIGVLIGMALLGALSRGLDRITTSGRTDLVRAAGVVWMANVWMMFASSDVWIVQNLFINGMPFFGLYAAHKLLSSSKAVSNEQTAKNRT
jgi:oligosaccharide repeat unit polymerase